MARFWAGCGAVNGLVAVGAGAFGAHALKTRLPPELLSAFETGARYQMFHALGLLLLTPLEATGVRVAPTGWAFLAGVVLFSGSLYALSLTGVTRLGLVTPFGGLSFLIGWALLAWHCFRR